MGEEGRTRGFGAVSVHPGKAVGLYSAEPSVRPIPANMGLKGAVESILRIRQSTRTLPSPSQIRAVQQRLEKSGRDAALRYLEHQTKRTSRIRFTWEPIYRDVESLLRKYKPQQAARALEVLADLAIAAEKREARA